LKIAKEIAELTGNDLDAVGDWEEVFRPYGIRASINHTVIAEIITRYTHLDELLCRSGLMALSVMRDAPVLMKVANPSSQDRTPRRAIPLAFSARRGDLPRERFSPLTQGRHRYLVRNIGIGGMPSKILLGMIKQVSFQQWHCSVTGLIIMPADEGGLM
jgi:hypothetical protein